MKNLLVLAALFPILFIAHIQSPFVHFPAETPGSITFIGNAGSDQEFTVERWKFSKVENAGQPEKIRVEAEMDMTSIRCDWADLLKGVKDKKDYFYVKKYKTASVTINGAKANADGSYSTDAELTLRGKTKTVPLTFSISKEAPFHIEAQGIVMRRKFGFTGGGPRDEVPVKVSADLP
ncbi:MAG: YceI family protein [Bacteroidia bacterium]